ncbi:hypothetical protein [Blastopirellula marina]|uniref:Uncharacterized protein n=1 Tax=Blastopirellula marina TaxID=124 RepID=A0A2S8GGW5_9BACT|nr:hypothetical protein [Blastopirellula marina]PQO43511.1 hypothetical protein C5Y93_22930 [Blastopirellula marina]
MEMNLTGTIYGWLCRNRVDAILLICIFIGTVFLFHRRCLLSDRHKEAQGTRSQLGNVISEFNAQNFRATHFRNDIEDHVIVFIDSIEKGQQLQLYCLGQRRQLQFSAAIDSFSAIRFTFRQEPAIVIAEIEISTLADQQDFVLPLDDEIVAQRWSEFRIQVGAQERDSPANSKDLATLFTVLAPESLRNNKSLPQTEDGAILQLRFGSDAAFTEDRANSIYNE